MKNIIIAIILIFAGLNEVQSQTMTSTRYGNQSRIYQAVQGTQTYTGGQYNGTPNVYNNSRVGIFSTRIVKNSNEITIGSNDYTIVGGGDLDFDNQYAAASGHGIFADGNLNSLTASVTTNTVYSAATSSASAFRTDAAEDGFYFGSRGSIQTQVSALAFRNRGTTFNSYSTTATRLQVNGNWYLYLLDRDNIQQEHWTRTAPVVPTYDFVKGNNLRIRRVVRANALPTTSPQYDSNPDLLQIWIQDTDVNSGIPFSEIVSDLQSRNRGIIFSYDERRRDGLGNVIRNCDDCYNLSTVGIEYVGYDAGNGERVEAIVVTFNASNWRPGIDNQNFVLNTLQAITGNDWGTDSSHPWIRDWSIIRLVSN